MPFENTFNLSYARLQQFISPTDLANRGDMETYLMIGLVLILVVVALVILKLTGGKKTKPGKDKSVEERLAEGHGGMPPESQQLQTSQESQTPQSIMGQSPMDFSAAGGTEPT